MARYEYEKELIDSKPIKCDECGSKIYYKGCGHYVCEQCKHDMYDYFGKVKKYLDDHGPTPSAIVSEETGVPHNILNSFLKKGRVEIPEGSKFYIKCEKCGCSLRYGRFCPECAKALAGGIKVILTEDIGEKPKKVSAELDGKMHFVNKR